MYVFVCVAALQNTNGQQSLQSHDNEVCHVHNNIGEIEVRNCNCLWWSTVCAVHELHVWWINTFIDKNIIDEMGASVSFTNTWDCVFFLKKKKKVVDLCGFVCTLAEELMLCVVSMTTASLSLSPTVRLFCSCSLSLVTDDRFNTKEPLTESQRRS